MARPLRIEYPGALYHVIARGNAKQTIFLDRLDYQRFLRVLAGASARYNLICHGYCLMKNHYHLLVETPDGNLSSAMRQLNGVYSQSFNRHHDRVGHLFQGRFKGILVERESYLLELSRYVVLNPVRAGLVKRAQDWEWSSYSATVGWRPCPDFLTVDEILACFATEDRSRARSLYRRFVAQAEDGVEEASGYSTAPILGGRRFRDSFRDALVERASLREIPRVERFAARPDLEELFRDTRDRLMRDQQIVAAHLQHGYTMKQIAEALGIHYTTVSQVVRKAEDASGAGWSM